MLVHEKVQEIDEHTEPAARDADRSNAHRVPRRSTWVAALAGAGVVAGIVAIAAITQSDHDAPPPVSDGSFEVAESSRFERLRAQAGVPVSDGSFEVAEASRFEWLRGQDGPDTVSDGSFDVAESSRFERLRDQAGVPVSDGSFDVAESNRFERLRDLEQGS